MEKKRMNSIAHKLGWKVDVDYPNWADNDLYLQTISNGYLLEGETPKDAYWRVSTTVARRLKKPELASKFFDYIWRNWLCLSTPVLSNTGTERGLPISCFTIDVDDTMYDIGAKIQELMMLSKNGGGVGIGINRIRPAGSVISNNGTTDGVVPFCKVFDSAIIAANQGTTRRGAASFNINIEHGDYWDWLETREPTGDVNRQSLNTNQCVVISDKFMQKLESGDTEARKRWTALLRKRKTTGEPYIMYKGNVNKANPEAYKKHGLNVFATNICTEICLFTDENHTFVCCLSSLNLAKYDEWKDTDLIYTSTYFLDGIMEEFIQRAKNMKGLENAVRFAEKSRALGLGVLGYHTYLQQRGIPFDSLLAHHETRNIFSNMKMECERASRDMAHEYGEPLWCVDTGFRNTHTRAIAPTVSNSKLSGNVSAGIEPWAANIFVEKSAKGTFIRKNRILENYLDSINLNTEQIWDIIFKDDGSIQNVKELNDYGFINSKLVNKNDHENLEDFIEFKSVFKTFREINQLELIRIAAIRQSYIDQGVSLNLAFTHDAKPKWINDCHITAWKLGIKSLYYMRTESVLKADVGNLYNANCESCDG